MTKRDSPISWRPSAEARLALAELLKSGRRRNEILNEVVIGAGLAQQILDAEKLKPKPKPAPNLPSVGRPDPDKLAAAQGWLKRPKK